MRTMGVVKLAILSVAMAAVVACGGSETTPADDDKPPAIVSGSSRQDHVAIVGAIEKTYAPEDVTAVKIGEHVGITLVEDSRCGVSFQFPAEMQPGTYPIGDRLRPGVLVYGEYSPDCAASGSYLSTEGALTLMSSGGRYSGTVEFSAALATDKTKTISVAGSFRDAVLR